MLQVLIGMFVGKTVEITHTNIRLGDVRGVCQAVHATPESQDSFDIELEYGHRLGFVPEVVTPTSTDGELRALAGGRRKIEVVEPNRLKVI